MAGKFISRFETNGISILDAERPIKSINISMVETVVSRSKTNDTIILDADSDIEL